jgi:hypothetical protein
MIGTNSGRRLPSHAETDQTHRRGRRAARTAWPEPARKLHADWWQARVGRQQEIDKSTCRFIDTDYNEESFFVRHAYFLGANDPYSAQKTTLKAEINEEAWATLNSDTSRPFEKPKSGRIAVKVINHLGDEVMKVFKVWCRGIPHRRHIYRQPRSPDW